MEDNYYSMNDFNQNKDDYNNIKKDLPESPMNKYTYSTFRIK